MTTDRDILAFLKRVKDDPAVKEWVAYDAGDKRGASALRAEWVRRTPGQAPPGLPVMHHELHRVQGQGWIEEFGGSYRISPAGEREIARRS